MTRKDARMAGVLFAPVPALVVGVFVMQGGEVPLAVWSLNLVAAVVGITAAALALTWPGLARPLDGPLRWFPLVVIILLGATLLTSGMEGVHRWLPLGRVRLHVGALLLPPLIVALWRASWVTSATTAVTVLMVLLIQPDAAQAASFGAAGIGIGLARRHQKGVVAMVTVTLLMVLASLVRTDPLDPVPFVEGIVGMAASQGFVLAGAALLSVGMLPLALAFLLQRPFGVLLAVYTLGTLVAAWLGNYPVPMLGYGVSPILGYYGAVAMYALVCRPEG